MVGVAARFWVVFALTIATTAVSAIAEERSTIRPYLGIDFGGRQGASQPTRDDFGIGLTYGGEMGFHYLPRSGTVSVGTHLQFRRSWYGVDDEASVSRSLKTVEYGLGAQIRVVPQADEPRVLVLRGGASLIRTNAEVMQTRSRVGPVLGLALEQYVSSNVGFSLLASLEHFHSEFAMAGLSFQVIVSN